MKGVATKGNTVTYGEYGLVATECGWITSNQIEAARIAMTRYTKRGGKVYIKIFPHKSVTKKPAEVRMGSGKGSPESWAAVVKKGKVLFEIGGIDEKIMLAALHQAGFKLPINTKIIKRTKALSQAELLKMEAEHESTLEEIEAEDQVATETVSDTGNETAEPNSETKGDAK